MVTCPRCGSNVSELLTITPDVVSEELIDAIDHGEDDITDAGGMKVCPECTDELTGG